MDHIRKISHLNEYVNFVQLDIQYIIYVWYFAGICLMYVIYMYDVFAGCSFSHVLMVCWLMFQNSI